MPNVTASFTVQSLEGALSNLVGLSLSQTYNELGYNQSFFETFQVAPNVTDQEFDLLPIANQILVLMNLGTQALSYRLNDVGGTQLSLPANNGFTVLTTTTPITKIFLTNSSLTILSSMRVLLIG